MRPTPLLAALAMSLAACGGGGGGGDGPTNPTPPNPPTPAPSAATVQALASSNAFSPSQVTIARNGTVTWNFSTLTHNVTFTGGTGAPANVPETTNAQVSRTFGTAGSFPYRCTLHDGMNGSVTVQ
jgi:plastocyanin